MNFLSVCSGIEAASVAFKPLEWKAIGFSEIEKFPCQLLAHHYPDVPNHGDMTLLPQKIINGEVDAPELFVGGTPCQAFSVAGKRLSLEDLRGNLTLTFTEIANAIDSVRTSRGEQPTIILWENVPGVLNTSDNAFGCFLGALASENCVHEPPGGRWTNAGCVFGTKRAVAWRVLDAQYFGLAQRRKRVFVVASAREGFDPTKILFESDSERRDSPPSRESGKSITTSVENSTGELDVCLPINTMTCQGRPSDELNPRMGLGIGDDSDPQNTLTKGHSHAVAYACSETSQLASGNATTGCLGAAQGQKLWLGNQEAFSGDFHIVSMTGGDIVGSLCARDYKTVGNQFVSEGKVFAINQETVSLPLTDVAGCLTSAYATKWNGNNSADTGDLFAMTGDTPCYALQGNMIGRSDNAGPQGSGVSEEVCFTQTKTDIHAVAYSFDSLNSNSMKSNNPHSGVNEVESSKTLDTSCCNPACNQGGIAIVEPQTYGIPGNWIGRDPKNGGNATTPMNDIAPCQTKTDVHAVSSNMQVRRLTPTECERLMGFPDGYTDIQPNGKPTPDGVRYKALGNSWAVPVVRWIGNRIDQWVKNGSIGIEQPIEPKPKSKTGILWS